MEPMCIAISQLSGLGREEETNGLIEAAVHNKLLYTFLIWPFMNSSLCLPFLRTARDLWPDRKALPGLNCSFSTSPKQALLVLFCCCYGTILVPRICHLSSCLDHIPCASSTGRVSPSDYNPEQAVCLQGLDPGGLNSSLSSWVSGMLWSPFTQLQNIEGDRYASAGYLVLRPSQINQDCSHGWFLEKCLKPNSFCLSILWLPQENFFLVKCFKLKSMWHLGKSQEILRKSSIFLPAKAKDLKTYLLLV